MENKTAYTSNDIVTILTHGKLDYYGKDENFTDPNNTVVISDSVITESITLANNFHAGWQKNIVFSNCLFQGPINIHQHFCIGTFHFEKCTFENSVSFYQLNTTISFNNDCHFKSELSIVGSGITECNIFNITVDGSLSIEGGYIKLTLQSINFNNNVSKKKGILKIRAAQFRGFEINNSNLLSIVIEDTVFHDGALFKQLYVDYFRVSMVETKNMFCLSVSNVQTLTIGNSKKCEFFFLQGNKIGEAVFDLSGLSKTDISGTFNSLKLYRTNDKDSSFNINDTKVNNLEFYSIKNEGILTLSGVDISANGRLYMDTSNLGKTDFFNCKFSNAVLEFKNSKITEIFIVETNFPKKVRFNNLKNHSQAQLAFGQLHTAFQKQGDTVRSLEYQSREIEAHFYGLKFWSRDFFKKLNLALNLISNNFGRYWALGILFTFGIGLLFFVFLLVSTDQYQFGHPTFKAELIPAYLKFMNPIRFIETDALSKNNTGQSLFNLNEWSYLWDFLGRVFVAYGFYQTIQAFRRFGRK